VRAESLGSEPPTPQHSSQLDELLAAAARSQLDSEEGEGEDSSPAASERGAGSAGSSLQAASGLVLLEQAIQFDDEDNKLPPGKRMRRHTIV
jgi:hypothetical protein